MAAKTIVIRDALVAELQKIGVSPATGWESGAGPVVVTVGIPKLEAIVSTQKRQLWVQHVGTHPQWDAFTAAGGMYRVELQVLMACPQPTGGEDLLSKLERDVRRAVQLGQTALEAVANAGVLEGDFEARGDLIEAGANAGVLHIFGNYLAVKGDP